MRVLFVSTTVLLLGVSGLAAKARENTFRTLVPFKTRSPLVIGARSQWKRGLVPKDIVTLEYGTGDCLPFSSFPGV